MIVVLKMNVFIIILYIKLIYVLTTMHDNIFYKLECNNNLYSIKKYFDDECTDLITYDQYFTNECYYNSNQNGYEQYEELLQCYNGGLPNNTIIPYISSDKIPKNSKKLDCKYVKLN